jgi:hypothetical protein
MDRYRLLYRTPSGLLHMIEVFANSEQLARQEINRMLKDRQVTYLVRFTVKRVVSVGSEMMR